MGWLLIISMMSGVICCDAFRTFSVSGGRTRHTFPPATRLFSQSSSLTPEEYAIQGKSACNVPYETVKKGLDVLYPPTSLQQRNALSRTDGYWSFVSQGKEPPQHLTYGEFDFYFFASLLDGALQHHRGTDGAPTDLDSWNDRVFVDIGSGSGRLVFGAAALHPNLRESRGIEILSGLSEHANALLSGACRVPACTTNVLPLSESTGAQAEAEAEAEAEADGAEANGASPSYIPMSPVQLTCASFEDPYDCYLGDASIIFVFSSCMPGETMESLGQALGRQCAPGTVVITTDYALPLSGYAPPMEDDERIPGSSFEIELVDTVEGNVWLTGGVSTAYVQRVESSSQWESNNGPYSRPVVSEEEKAYRLVQQMEAGELTDTEAFMRNVHNNMIFSGVPNEWLPKDPEGG